MSGEARFHSTKSSRSTGPAKNPQRERGEVSRHGTRPGTRAHTRARTGRELVVVAQVRGDGHGKLEDARPLVLVQHPDARLLGNRALMALDRGPTTPPCPRSAPATHGEEAAKGVEVAPARGEDTVQHGDGRVDVDGALGRVVVCGSQKVVRVAVHEPQRGGRVKQRPQARQRSLPAGAFGAEASIKGERGICPARWRGKTVP